MTYCYARNLIHSYIHLIIINYSYWNHLVSCRLASSWVHTRIEWETYQSCCPFYYHAILMLLSPSALHPSFSYAVGVLHSVQSHRFAFVGFTALGSPLERLPFHLIHDLEILLDLRLLPCSHLLPCLAYYLLQLLWLHIVASFIFSYWFLLAQL